MKMTRPIRAICAAVALSSGVIPAISRAADEAQIARGRYLASDVAMCVQCHSPRSGRGELEPTQLFRGAPIPVASPFAERPWAVQAPVIAGLPGWKSEDAIALLVTGQRPTGQTPRPPMPPYRMTREDATAIVAYLKSLAAAR